MQNAINLKRITAALSFLGKAFTKLHLFFISVPMFLLKDKIVLDYLYKNYRHFIQNYSLKNNKNSYGNVEFKKVPIWVCWLQGEQSAPQLVKNCIASIRRHAGNHPVVVVTFENIKDYIELPEYIYNNMEKHLISYTNFSDIIRSALLADYGGLWIDATFFISQDLPEEYFEFKLFSAGKQIEPKNRRNTCISGSRWVSSFIGSGKPNNLLFCFLRDFFFEYEKRDGWFIDYLLIDYILYIAYSSFPDIKKQIDDIPSNNINIHTLFHSMNKTFNKKTAQAMLFNNTITFKLSYKRKWRLKNICGQKTFYYYFLNGCYDILYE